MRRGMIFTCALALLFATGLSPGGAMPRGGRGEPAVVPVRFTEGMAHGFLELETAAGVFLSHGELLQVPRSGTIESRMVFFLPNSVFEESVTFTQRDVFTMLSYHLVQRGPAFAEDLDATLARSGAYVVKTRSHKDGEEKKYEGTLKLPPDTYNGMIITIAKNLPADGGATVHVVAFTPKPYIVEAELVRTGPEHVLLGRHEEVTSHVVVKPRLGTLLKVVAALKGQSPPDSHVWVVTDQVPAFVRFEGPMFSGPVWRVNLTSPTWPQPANGNRPPP